MDSILQIALTMASIFFIVLSACLIPLVILAYREIGSMSRAMKNLEARVEVLIDNSNDLIGSVNRVADKLNCQLEDVGEVVETVHSWTSRTNRVVSEVSAFVQLPVFSLARHANMLRRGAATFLQVLMKKKSQR